ncbi:MAG: TetR family transcriptional regulator [Pseudomonadota bacterium]
MSSPSPRTAIVDATLKLAADKGWTRLKLSEIATEAGVTLSDIAENFSSKADILSAFMARTDAQLLERLEAEGIDAELPRDKLFDVLMCRFELLEPHKPALRRISADLRQNPQDWAVAGSAAMRSQNWMLAGAGIEDTGFRALLKSGGLAFVYSRVFQTWLDEDDPGLSKTMAELDRRLRQGETWLERSGTPVAIGNAVFQFAKAFMRDRNRRRSGSSGPSASPAE